MTAEELHRELGLLIEQGHGARPVRVMSVEEGVTFAIDISVQLSRDYDGDLVWLILGDAHEPAWFPKA